MKFVRQNLFKTGGGGEGLKNFVGDQKLQPPLRTHTNISSPPWAHILYTLTPKFNWFHENRLFITFINNVCQWDMNINSTLSSQGMKIVTPPSLVQKKFHPPNFPDLPVSIFFKWLLSNDTKFWLQCKFYYSFLKHLVKGLVRNHYWGGGGWFGFFISQIWVPPPFGIWPNIST